VVPIFVAVMVLLIRVLLIGTFSAKGGKLFSQGEARTTFTRPAGVMPSNSFNRQPQPASMNAYRPASKVNRTPGYVRPEPGYQNLAVQGKPVHEAEYVDVARSS
jgi:hypothetical protein